MPIQSNKEKKRETNGRKKNFHKFTQRRKQNWDKQLQEVSTQSGTNDVCVSIMCSCVGLDILVCFVLNVSM